MLNNFFKVKPKSSIICPHAEVASAFKNYSASRKLSLSLGPFLPKKSNITREKERETSKSFATLRSRVRLHLQRGRENGILESDRKKLAACHGAADLIEFRMLASSSYIYSIAERTRSATFREAISAAAKLEKQHTVYRWLLCALFAPFVSWTLTVFFLRAFVSRILSSLPCPLFFLPSAHSSLSLSLSFFVAVESDRIYRAAGIYPLFFFFALFLFYSLLCFAVRAR